MTLTKRKQELPVFGDMMANLFDDRFFTPIHKPTKSSPSVNIFENETEFVIQLAAPGMSKEAFNIDLKNNALTVSAENKSEKKESNGKYSLKEFNFSSFKRSFTLPKNTDKENISAQYQEGILELKIAKKELESEKVKQIAIS